MTESLRRFVRELFEYPSAAVSRHHGPSGYVDWASYKPWLRDEFLFRCVYCLSRERWKPEGQDAFSVDHVVPQSTKTARADPHTRFDASLIFRNGSRFCERRLDRRDWQKQVLGSVKKRCETVFAVERCGSLVDGEHLDSEDAQGIGKHCTSM